jgi:hypothetical protein
VTAVVVAQEHVTAVLMVVRVDVLAVRVVMVVVKVIVPVQLKNQLDYLDGVYQMIKHHFK